jgi:hypothetical protein
LANPTSGPVVRGSAGAEGMSAVSFGSCGSFTVGTPLSGPEQSPDSTETASTVVEMA